MARAVSVKILFDEKELQNFKNLVIHQEVYAHNTFELTCPPDVFESFSNINKSAVLRGGQDHIGKKVKIMIRHPEQDNYKTIFKGVILEVEGSRENDPWSGTISFKGSSYDIYLDGTKKSRFLENMTLSDIVNKLKNEHLPGNVYDKMVISPKYTEKIPWVTQYHETNFEILSRLAQRYGEWLLTTGENRFYFGAPPDNKISINMETDLLHFSYSIKSANLGIKFNAYNNKDKKYVFVKSPSINTEGLTTAAFGSSKELFEDADNYFYSNASPGGTEISSIQASIDADYHHRAARISIAKGSSFNPDLTVGAVLHFEKSDFNYGDCRIVSLVHTCDLAGNYLNHFIAIPASMQVPFQADPFIVPNCETQSALITNTNDPDGLGRVKVKFFWGDPPVESPWIRVATPYAGNKQGFFFIPEVDQEVLVGFEKNNAERPYVLNAHYNGKDKPEDWKSDQNYKKAIRTKSGHTIEFNDEDGKEEIVIYDKDKQNTITLSSHGKLLTIDCKGDLKINAQKIDITAEKDYTLKVKGEIDVETEKSLKMVAGKDCSMEAKGKISTASMKDTEITATGNCKVKSNKDVSIEALSNLTAKANAKAELSGTQLAVKGTATAEISASGQTVVKGGIVQIN